MPQMAQRVTDSVRRPRSTAPLQRSVRPRVRATHLTRARCTSSERSAHRGIRWRRSPQRTVRTATDSVLRFRSKATPWSSVRQQQMLAPSMLVPPTSSETPLATSGRHKRSWSPRVPSQMHNSVLPSQRAPRARSLVHQEHRVARDEHTSSGTRAAHGHSRRNLLLQKAVHSHSAPLSRSLARSPATGRSWAHRTRSRVRSTLAPRSSTRARRIRTGLRPRA